MLTRSPFRRLADGESFFYALLLEKGSWRREEELLLGVDTYRERFMTLYPDEYGEAIVMEKVAEHTTQLHHVNLYNEIVETIIEEFGREDMSLHNLIENQLQSLKRLSMRANTLEDYNPVLHMDDDQYNAYSTITTFLGATQRSNAQRLFFVTGSAGVGKSYLLSALERWVQGKGFWYLKLAPTGIAAINIHGNTIHSVFSITKRDDDRHKHFVTSIFQSPAQQDDLRKVLMILIDEISMVSAELLSFISSIFSKLHGNGKPFGGITVIAFGDLLQLPPVSGQRPFVCDLWRLFFPVVLKESWWQENNPAFFVLLNKVRFGEISPHSWETFFSIFNFDSIVRPLCFILL